MAYSPAEMGGWGKRRAVEQPKRKPVARVGARGGVKGGGRAPQKVWAVRWGRGLGSNSFVAYSPAEMGGRGGEGARGERDKDRVGRQGVTVTLAPARGKGWGLIGWGHGLSSWRTSWCPRQRRWVGARDEECWAGAARAGACWMGHGPVPHGHPFIRTIPPVNPSSRTTLATSRMSCHPYPAHSPLPAPPCAPNRSAESSAGLGLPLAPALDHGPGPGTGTGGGSGPGLLGLGLGGPLGAGPGQLGVGVGAVGSMGGGLVGGMVPTPLPLPLPLQQALHGGGGGGGGLQGPGAASGGADGPEQVGCGVVWGGVYGVGCGAWAVRVVGG